MTWLVLLALLVLGTLAAGAAAQVDETTGSASSSQESSAPGSYIVTFAAGTSDSAARALLASVDATVGSHIAPLRMYSVVLPGATASSSVATLEADSSVARVEADRARDLAAAPDDPSYSDQWALTRISWDQARDSVTPSGSATVAILDTGVDASHPDLDGNLVAGTATVEGGSPTIDPNGHGTKMAGIVAAETNNGLGVAGVGYAGVKLMPVTVLGADGTGQDSDIIEGVVWAADHGADVILMSFSNPGFSESLQAAIDYAWSRDVVLVAATGNGGSSEPTFPAGDRGVVGVSSTGVTDSLSAGSNYGPAAFLAAPGESVLSTQAGGGYGAVSGTSASAAIVAGSAALLRASSVGASNGVIVSRLARNAEPAGTAEQTGNGRVDLSRAIVDTDSSSVQPAGAAPVGGGGPFVGPYVAAGGVRIRSDDVSSSATFAWRTDVAAVGQTIYARTNSATVGRGYKLELFNQSGASVFLSACQQATSGSSVTASFAPTTPSGTSAQQWRWVVHEWGTNVAGNHNSCTALAQSEDDDNTRQFAVAEIKTYSSSALTTERSTFGGSNTVYLVVNGFIPDHGDAEVTWIKPDGSVACANLGGSERPDSALSGRLPGSAGSFLQFPPNTTGGDAWNVNSAYEVGNCLAATLAGNPGTWKIKLTPKDDDVRGFTTDAFTVDTTSPSVTINQASGQADPTTGSPIDFTVVFSESVTGFDAADVSLSGTAGATTKVVTGSGTTYNVAVSGMTQRGTVVATVPAGGAQDAAGNGNAASTSTDNTVTWDRVPTASVNITPDPPTTNQTLTATATKSDPDGDATDVTFVWKVNGVTKRTFTSASSTSATATDTFDLSVAGNGDKGQTVSVEATPNDGLFAGAAANDSVTVANSAPTVAFTTAPATANEGQTKSYAFTAADADGDTLSFAAGYPACGIGGSLQGSPTAAGGTFDCLFPDGPANPTVAVKVTDGTAASNEATQAVTVANVAPTVTLSASNSLSANEGSSHTYSYTISDPGQDTVQSVSTSCGANGTKVLGSDTNTDTSGSFGCTFPDGPASSTVSAEATDSDGAAGNTATQSVTVNNVAPTVTFTASPASADEGQTKTYTYSISDPGSDTVTSVATSCGASGTKSNASNTNTSGSFQCTFPDGPASSTVTAQATDSDGDAGNTASQTVTIANVAPTVAFTSAPSSSNEGETKTYSYSISDPGQDTVTSVATSCGLNGTTSNASNTDAGGSFDCTFPDGPASSTVSAQATDSDGDAGNTATQTVAVANVAPTVTLDGDAAADEGETKAYTFTTSDPGDDTFALDGVDCGGEGVLVAPAVFDSIGGAGSFECRFPDGPASSVVSVTVEDSDGASGSDSVTVGVANVAPTVVLVGDAAANEGQTKSYSYTASDPGVDTLTVSEDCGANGVYTDTAAANSFECRFPDGPADSLVSVSASDGDPADHTGSDSVEVHVSNVAPSISLSGAASANEGETESYSFSVSDPGDDTHTITADCGTNGVQVGSTSYDASTKSGGFQCRFPDGPATSNVTARVSDSDGATDVDNRVVVVTVSNVAPTVVLSGDETANEGTTHTYSYTVTDPGVDADTMTISESCGANGNYTNTPAANSFDCTFPDGPESSTVRVTANDGDPANNTGFDELEVQIANVEPSISLRGPNAAEEGETKAYSFTVTDPGYDTHTVTTDCGANGVKVTGSDSFDQGAMTGGFQCRFPDGPASTDVTARVTDSDGASDTDNQIVTVGVANVAPTVTLTGDNAADEGQTKTYSYTATDPGDDHPLTITEECGTNGVYTDTPAANSFECRFPDGPRSSVVTVTANDGTVTGSGSITVSIANVEPSINLTGPATADEGDTSTYGFTVSDPGTADTHTIVTACGAGGEKVAGSDAYNPSTKAGSFQCFFPDGPATTNVTAKATDSDGASDTDNQVVTVEVNNVAPTVTLDGSGSANEGQTKHYTFTTSDPGTETFTLDSASCGSGGVKSNEAFDPATGAGSFDCSFPDGPASSSVGVTVGDGDGLSDSDSIAVTIANVAPTVTLSGDATANEGTTRTYTYTATDPGADHPLAITESCGVNGDYTNTDAANSFECTFPDGPADSTVEVTANDGTVTSSDSIDVAIANVAPVAANDDYETAEDVPLVVPAPGVLGNDTDAGDDSLTAVLGTGPAHGTLVLNADGSFTYAPDTDYNGPDSFTYRASDGLAQSNLATVAIDVTAVNDAPVCSATAILTNEDTAGETEPVCLDVDGDALTYSIVDQATNGTASVTPAGRLRYVPDANFNGTDSFTYKANDGTVDSNIADVAVAVTAVNDAPTCSPRSITTEEDTPGETAPVCADVDGDSLTYEIVAQPADGTASVTAGGNLRYVPDPNFNGADSFTYRANDGQEDSAAATVAVTVTPVNDAPVAVNDGYTTAEDTALTVPAPGVLGNDTDVDSATLTAQLVSGASHGTVVLNLDGSFTYTPNLNYNGSDSFTYKASDGAADSNTATVSLTVTSVNDAPVAVSDSYLTDEDGELDVPAPGVLGNDSDVDGDSLSPVLVDDVQHGALTLRANGSFTYTPTANYNGPDSFTYRASDGSAQSDLATVTIAVRAVNDAPTCSATAIVTDEDTAAQTDPVCADIDSATLTYSIVDEATNGTASVTDAGKLRYVPNPNSFGPDSFTYRANDGEANSNAANVAVTVTPVNDAPVAVNDGYTTAEDTALAVPAPGVLGNDSDVDSVLLTAQLVSGASHGTVVLNLDGSFTYTPNVHYNGPDSFTYRASDGPAQSNVATVSLTVTPVNDLPTCSDTTLTTAEDTPGETNPVCADIDGDTLTYEIVEQGTKGTASVTADKKLHYVPAPNENGPDSFTYRANDGGGNSNVATVDVTITPVNDAPVAVNDGYTTAEDTALTVPAPGVLGNDSDVENDSLTAVLQSGPSHGTLVLNPNGSFTYTPNAHYNGADSFTYKASDGTAQSNTATVSLTVTAVNDAPIAVDDSATTPAGQAITFGPGCGNGLQCNDTDVDNTTAQLSVTGVTAPANGTAVRNGDGSVTYTPNPAFIGPDTFDYTVSDGDKSDVGTVTVTVMPGSLTTTGVVTDVDDKSVSSFDVLFGKGSTNSTLKLKSTNPGTFRVRLNLENNTGVPINGDSGNKANAVFTIPGMPSSCGQGISCAPAGDKGNPAFTVQGTTPVKAHPDDKTDELKIDVRYLDYAGYVANGNTCADKPTTPWSTTIPAGDAAKCIKVSGFAIPVGRSARITLHLEFRPKETDGWPVSPDSKINFRAGFSFGETTTVTYPAVPTVRTSSMSFGIIGVGKKVTALGGFVFDSVGNGVAGTQVRAFSTAPAAGTGCTASAVAEDTTQADGFWFIWKTGANQATGTTDLPSGVQYTLVACQAGLERGRSTIPNKLGSKEFVAVDFRLSP